MFGRDLAMQVLLLLVLLLGGTLVATSTCGSIPKGLFDLLQIPRRGHVPDVNVSGSMLAQGPGVGLSGLPEVVVPPSTLAGATSVLATPTFSNLSRLPLSPSLGITTSVLATPTFSNLSGLQFSSSLGSTTSVLATPTFSNLSGLPLSPSLGSTTSALATLTLGTGSKAAAGSTLPRRIWSLWLQGDPNCTAPDLNKICIFMWPHLNGPAWNFTLLTKNSVHDLFPHLQELFEHQPRTLAQQSDMIRLHILYQFGGVWVDASLLPLKPLDDFIFDYVSPTGYFAYLKGGVHITSTWFIAAVPKHPLIKEWLDRFMARWKKHVSFDYYEVHLTFAKLVLGRDASAKAAATWNRVKKISSSGPHQCLPGCDNFFLRERGRWPPFLKRPYQSTRRVPPKWFKSYWASMSLELDVDSFACQKS